MGWMMLHGVKATLDAGRREADQVLAALVQQDTPQRYGFRLPRGTQSALHSAEQPRSVCSRRRHVHSGIWS